MTILTLTSSTTKRPIYIVANKIIAVNTTSALFIKDDNPSIVHMLGGEYFSVLESAESIANILRIVDH